MSEGSDTADSSSRGRGRGRGRGKSRGGLGKYLRARGRGRGFGRSAEFTKRLLLEGEEDEEEEDEEEVAARRAKYSRRRLGTNTDRYAEPEPELDSDGEPIVEPEVDLSAFLEKQKLTDDPGPSAPPPPEDDDDVDHSLDNLTTRKTNSKGKAQRIEWDESLEDLLREKAAAEATRELKNRFRAKSDKLRTSDRPKIRDRKKELSYVDAPPLPLPENGRSKTEMEKMEDFLDDLLS
ncbi:hypothetical protein GGU10DRAFT_392869 [Lentinula aff. detonsa]|uniref:Uncharacterized protein n=1 Tax=Lentinula aff. detonsa TaxID=2804958 RepID=A0AA38NEB2_9AGAR|nr:hypothetical protein GGU10DRAFT_392869 [Lentinula aff. detonsa]